MTRGGVPGFTLPPATPSAVGSLPLTDAEEAAALALRLQPELPAAPQLPRRGPSESMLGQVATGMPGVSVAPDGASLVLDGRGWAPAPAEAPLDEDAWGATLAFLRAAGSSRRRPAGCN